MNISVNTYGYACVRRHVILIARFCTTVKTVSDRIANARKNAHSIRYENKELVFNSACITTPSTHSLRATIYFLSNLPVLLNAPALVRLQTLEACNPSDTKRV